MIRGRAGHHAVRVGSFFDLFWRDAFHHAACILTGANTNRSLVNYSLVTVLSSPQVLSLLLDSQLFLSSIACCMPFWPGDQVKIPQGRHTHASSKKVLE